MKLNKIMKKIGSLIGAVGLLFMKVGVSLAVPTGMAWETPLQKLQASLTGPVAYWVSIIAIALAGLMALFNRQTDGVFHQLISVIIVISLIIAAVPIINVLFPQASGLVF